MDARPRGRRAAVTGAGTPRAGAGARRRKPSTAKAIAHNLRDVHSRVVRAVEDSLTSAAELADGNESSAPQANAVARTWQHAAYGYARSVPELSSAQIYVGNCLSRVRLVVGKRDPDGTVEQGFEGETPVEGFDSEVAKQAASLISQLRSGSGGQSELLRRFGEQVFIVGEMWLLPMDSPYGVTWEALSTSELSTSNKGKKSRWVVNNGPGQDPEELPEGVVPLRVWRPDTQFRKMASSSVRACLEILEELVVLTRLVRSAAISRIALAGILAIADEFDSPDEEGEDGQTAEESNPLAVDIINTGSKAIDDPASAAAWMPYILQGEVDLIERGIKHIRLQTDDAEHVVKRQEAVERLARGIDLPVEATMGHQQTTFANAMQVSADVFNIHLAPLIQLLCDALTVGYLWPAMAQSRNIPPERIAEVGYPEDILQAAVTYDASKLVSRPDRAKDVLEAYKEDLSQTAIANSELRQAVGLDADGGPDEEEIKRRIDAIRLTKIRETIQMPADTADTAVPIGDAAADGVVPGQSEGEKTIAARTSQDVAAGEQMAVTRLVAERIAAAAELTIERACEKVGAKLKSRIKSKPSYDTVRQAVEDVPNGSVARILGPEVSERILGTDDPVAAELASFHRAVRRWADQARLAGPDAIADRATDFVATRYRLQLFGDTLVAPSEEYAAIVTAG